MAEFFNESKTNKVKLAEVISDAVFYVALSDGSTDTQRIEELQELFPSSKEILNNIFKDVQKLIQ